MTRLVISASARRDIANALQHSGQRWGAGQRRKYRLLIENALNDLLESPEHPASRARDEIRPGIRTFHITRPGRPARHLVVYRIAPDGGVHVIRLLHGAMELSRALSRAP
ncbi:MAG: type II toxin-antitoxin system RelE/ParE family toxin [Pseudomonadota bacterium]|nr:type II toxin-antitoxin system RelE/ParE family toxin [Pseudomonadota bacterium]